MTLLKELEDRYAGLMVKSDEIRLRYQGKAADMTGQQEQEWTNILNEAEQVKDLISAERRAESLKAFDSNVTNAIGTAISSKGLPGVAARDEEATTKAFNKLLRGQRLNEAEHDLVSKAYQSDNPTGGGFLVLPQQLSSEILTLMKNYTFIRGMARTFSVTGAESLGVPAMDTDPSDADWTSELLTGSEETTSAFGKRELKPNPLAKSLKLSKKFVRQVANAEGFILDRLSYKMAVSQEKGYLTGTGANSPLGVFVASTYGISTSRDTTAAGATAIVADDLINTFYSLKAQYRQRAEWVLNRAVVQAARKLKDTTNNYIWATGLGPGGGLQGTPETLLGRPIRESEYAPGTITTGLYTAVLGDFSHYWIADALDMQLQVALELYAATNQNGYFLRCETDGMPVLEEAFARLKQG